MNLSRRSGFSVQRASSRFDNTSIDVFSGWSQFGATRATDGLLGEPQATTKTLPLGGHLGGTTLAARRTLASVLETTGPEEDRESAPCLPDPASQASSKAGSTPHPPAGTRVASRLQRPNRLRLSLNELRPPLSFLQRPHATPERLLTLILVARIDRATGEPRTRPRRVVGAQPQGAHAVGAQPGEPTRSVGAAGPGAATGPSRSWGAAHPRVAAGTPSPPRAQRVGEVPQRARSRSELARCGTEGGCPPAGGVPRAHRARSRRSRRDGGRSALPSGTGPKARGARAAGGAARPEDRKEPCYEQATGCFSGSPTGVGMGFWIARCAQHPKTRCTG